MAHALLPLFPWGALSTRVNSDAFRIRVDGQIWFEYATCGWKYFESGKKKLRIQKYQDTPDWLTDKGIKNHHSSKPSQWERIIWLTYAEPRMKHSNFVIPLARFRGQMTNVIVCKTICPAYVVARVPTGCAFWTGTCCNSRRRESAIGVVFTSQTFAWRICKKANYSVLRVMNNLWGRQRIQ